MKALAAFAVLLAACSPEIVSGAYSCGDQELCPPDLVCNGPDNTCVDPPVVQPFACDPTTLHEPDDNAAQAFALPAMQCVSNLYRANGCLAAADLANWSKFATPSNCTSVSVHASIAFPIAFQPLGLELWDIDANQMIAVDDACTSGVVASGDTQRCLAQHLDNSKNYGIVVIPSGADCGGNCNFNRYNLTLQLVTP
jgi:hypothetical protein